MSSYTDASGKTFTTADGKPPSVANIPVTVADGSGKPNNGIWDGSKIIVPNK